MSELNDIIEGKVTDIIDGDTIIIKVIAFSKQNTNKYKETERVVITGSESFELHGGAGERNKSDLEKNLKGKSVRCFVEGKDTVGRLLCKITVKD